MFLLSRGGVHLQGGPCFFFREGGAIGIGGPLAWGGGVGVGLEGTCRFLEVCVVGCLWRRRS